MHLIWPIKRSFQEYVGEVGGTIAVHEPAERRAEAFVFPADDNESFRFRGGVSFRAHDGLLSVDISDPWLERDGDERVVSVETAFSAGVTERVIIARLGAGDYASTLSVAPRITVLGSRLLGEVYQPGSLLDELEVSPT